MGLKAYQHHNGKEIFCTKLQEDKCENFVWEKKKNSLSFLLSSFETVVHMLNHVYHLQY